MIYKILPMMALLLMSFSANQTNSKTPLVASHTASALETKAASIYGQLHSATVSALPKMESFTKALEGFYALKAKGKIEKDVLTLVDFSLSSNTKRLWVIDLGTNTILFHSLVAHGRNTGEEFAKVFSNKAESYKSSLGFYITGEIYTGKHGKSLRLDGQERGVNDNARHRAVVMHGADYVSESFIRNHNRLGRSQGCPAIPVELTDGIIDAIKDKSCLFIYHPSRKAPSRLVS
ncbi:murein L,D-transpeptidase catalytic domain family protein [Flavobacterium caeni]|uniref:L,D-transpeptidase catalytic domain n=1 Tax=Flavobacterium caeni TaxID=490189 RepID=A0A1G5I647_9FLAO|nr:murein L,D-transpeptidase catalytic domain family protein [Flavobacterium caeni]SCY71576.1 L,D-transpeptidase catalytic domain [Flavobacterium caeni]